MINSIRKKTKGRRLIVMRLLNRKQKLMSTREPLIRACEKCRCIAYVNYMRNNVAQDIIEIDTKNYRRSNDEQVLSRNNQNPD